MENIEKLIISTYENGLSMRQTAKKLDISFDKVKYILKKYHINTNKTRADYPIYRKHKIDLNYFEEINTEAKSYFLGLLAADGYVSHRGFKLTLKDTDKSILEKFEKELQLNKDYTSMLKSQGVYTVLTIDSVKMSKDLINLGIVQRKSKILKPPTKVPNHLMKHFVRGYFDGDGSIWFDKSVKNYKCQIVTTFEMGNFFQNFFNTNTKLRATQSENICRYSFSGNQHVKKQLNKIYTDATFYIERKYQRYLDCINL